MAWVAVDKDGTEWVFDSKPVRLAIQWEIDGWDSVAIELPPGSIERLIGRKLLWEDEPVELK